MLYIRTYKTEKLKDAERSLDQTHNIDDIIDALSNEEKNNASLILQLKGHRALGSANFWDLLVKYTKLVDVGDSLGIICGSQLRFIGRIEGFVWDEDGVIGDAFMEWQRQFKKPYQRVLVLRSFRAGAYRISIPSNWEESSGCVTIGPGFFKLEGRAEKKFLDGIK